MYFTLAESYNHRMLIIENNYPNETWVLSASEYLISFDKTRPFIKSMAGMTIKTLAEKEALRLLEECANSNLSGCSCKIKDFIEQYKELPF